MFKLRFFLFYIISVILISSCSNTQSNQTANTGTDTGAVAAAEWSDKSVPPDSPGITANIGSGAASPTVAAPDNNAIYSLTAASFQTQALKYLQEKYGFAFAIVGGIISDQASYMTAGISPLAGICSERIRATVRFDKTDGTFTDDYVIFVDLQEITKFMSGIAEPIYGANMVSFYNKSNQYPLMPQSVNTDTPLSDVIKNIGGDMFCIWYVGPSRRDKDVDAEKLRQVLQDNGCRLKFSVVYLKDKSAVKPDSSSARNPDLNISDYITDIKTYTMGTDYKFEAT